MKTVACVLLFALTIIAEETAQKKRGLLGFGYGLSQGYGHSDSYIPSVLSSPTISYSKHRPQWHQQISLGNGMGYYGYGYDHGLGYGHIGFGYGHGYGVGYGLGYRSLHSLPYTYYSLSGHGHGYYGHGPVLHTYSHHAY